MSMSPETAMRQASMTAREYLLNGQEAVEELFPDASDDAKLAAASQFAVAASLDYLGAALSGSVDGTLLQGWLTSK